jgi:hypothetical protein
MPSSRAAGARLAVPERESEEGWQATTVRLIGRHHLQEKPRLIRLHELETSKNLGERGMI